MHIIIGMETEKFGYGGYKYIPGRWQPVAKKIDQGF